MKKETGRGIEYSLYFEKRNIIEMHGNGQKNRVYMIEDGQLVMIKKDLTDKNRKTIDTYLAQQGKKPLTY